MMEGLHWRSGDRRLAKEASPANNFATSPIIRSPITRFQLAERALMTKRVLALGCFAALLFSLASVTQTAGPGQAPSSAASAPATPQLQSQRQLLDRYC